MSSWPATVSRSPRSSRAHRPGRFDDERLGPVARGEVRSADEVFFSPVTPWELGIERALGKLRYPDDLIAQLGGAGIEQLPIAAAHGEAAASLPPHHRDPFDRMLVAQAQAASLTLVTADAQMDAYTVPVLDATS